MEALKTQDMVASKKNYKKSYIKGNSLENNFESNKKEKHKKRKRRHEINGEATRNSKEEGFTSRKKKRKRLQEISASIASKRHKLIEDNDLESAVSSTDLRVSKKSRVKFVEEENYADEAKDEIEPSRVEIFLKIHKRRKDGRPLDKKSAKAAELIEEKLNNGELSNEESINGVAWEGDVYSQVLKSDRSGYVHGVIGIGIIVTAIGLIVGCLAAVLA
ncbi:uncharacterized protein LOC130939835 [Arachis stenosperma]|uniref:uncharacterized protein LOC130939835 n=1 Tax=Arachis stenosperma TaxID=217475 RepID=UPI0025AC19FC|nr:uncharacterized protein LOC130939835 [Arachis stenosperma]